MDLLLMQQYMGMLVDLSIIVSHQSFVLKMACMTMETKDYLI